MIAFVPWLFAVVGLLVYVLASNAKVVEVGRLAFAASFLVAVWTLAGHTVRLLP